MKKNSRIIIVIILLAAAICAAVYYRNYWLSALTRVEQAVQKPCSQPITYSLGDFDKRFGISQKDFLKAVAQASQIWDKAAGSRLFAQAASGTVGEVKINLIYDYRQQSTADLQKMGLVVKDDQASYDALKSKYEALTAQLAQEKKQIDAQVADFNTKKSRFDAQAAPYSRRGAPPSVYDQLQNEQNALNAELASIKQMEADYNNKINQINALVAGLNKLADALNLNVDKYNAVGSEVSSTLGSEFQEGDYEVGPLGRVINIYQYDDYTMLVRLLAHELGHALGLEHVSDPKAIMYRLNNGINEKPTAADLAELDVICGIKLK